MADSANIVVRVEQNGFRNAVIRASLTSDGTGLAGFKVYDASSAGAFGVSAYGQTFYPGAHTTLVGLDYDVQDMKLKLQWDATTPEDILALGAAPESFDWCSLGGLRVPAGLAGATGSILLTTVDQAVNSTFFCILKIRKNVP